ncbi:hypothetical protein [Peribacillus asahii]|uniref:hypothetical protein n=1 Tax=Peribacillus asahii TaxID=228899 RepID=UPI002079A280|nr:hypothetical protein [Peribacillus asahii]USK87559.1 hypothetical protein LIT35_23785 [Peribacillus asahii]
MNGRQHGCMMSLLARLLLRLEHEAPETGPDAVVHDTTIVGAQETKKARSF